jgi:hypothetical protein
MKFPDPFKFPAQQRYIPQIPCPDAFPAGIQRIFIRGSNPDTAATMTVFSPRGFPDTICRLVVWRDDQSPVIDTQAGIHIKNSLADQHVTFNQQSPGVNDDVRGENGLNTRNECTRPELREGMVAPIRGNNIMPGLGATVISNNHSGIMFAHKVIGKQTLTGIPKTQVNHNADVQIILILAMTYEWKKIIPS